MVTCPPVPNVNNSVVSTTEAMFGSVPQYSCRHGYKFPDDTVQKSIECDMSGQWTGNISDCIGIHIYSLILLILCMNEYRVGCHLPD